MTGRFKDYYREARVWWVARAAVRCSIPKLYGVSLHTKMRNRFGRGQKGSASISQFRACLQRIFDEPGRQSGVNVLPDT